MADAKPSHAPKPDGATGVLVLASGEVVWGRGFGAEGQAVGEVCFHTAMTGYQEIMTDPSFAGQIITFTFPHIGNVGANPDDIEADAPHALGMIVREDVTAPSNFRAVENLDGWMRRHARIGLSGIDTRALTRRIRAGGAPNGVVAHSAAGQFDLDALLDMARAWPGLEGMDLAKTVSTETHYAWGQTREGGPWRLGFGYGAQGDDERPHVVAIDYGSKHNIFRNLVHAGAKVSVLPATATFEQVMALQPDGIFLSNGPGDPAATGEYAVPVIRQLLDTQLPLFGICLGHQLLALAVGARTTKMFQGHRGANHPVKRVGPDGTTEQVEITSMNHGFAVERDSLPANARETHVSLFDGSNAGLELTDRPAFSVQYHPEASPGPQDSLYLFERFVGIIGK
ncbi:glutamine-hydrolyzing carbamoyl-phosphate synthase small subunit [Sphingomonas sp. HHU CXW]|uniref:Carbamoyl phosphate synthase small chain n=1 Tax=Sphingomonas hominis TaxID=2741495 RepID=A0ABX2JIN8_9SPHN|nr:glutamine-hydrolyzing carbamoyl-phosphate synthase small subunit [Sphingomonas hominis]NTS64307.1 glutamine-hydrolyzing carbamoyl-phosphate synthase small subunit [Sphingomonas hominis]